MTEIEGYKVGDRVEKYKGDYTASGTVIAVGFISNGKRRYLVEYDTPKYLLHTHSDNDLRPFVEKPPGYTQYTDKRP